MRRVLIPACFLASAALAFGLPEIRTALKPATLQAFEAYMRTAEARIDKQVAGSGFLWADGSPERMRQIRQGKAIAQPWVAKGDIDVPDGLIHDWIGAVFIPGATLERTLAMVQDYDHHKNVYKPEVVDSKTLSRNGDEFKVYLRLLKKQVLTVVLNTDHDVRYFRVGEKRCYARSYSTKIAEVEKAGTAAERETPVGKDHGFLWRVNSFWRFEERDGGVYVEIEAISLTRDVPTGLGWLINPIVRNLPKDSLSNTLTATRRALTG